MNERENQILVLQTAKAKIKRTKNSTRLQLKSTCIMSHNIDKDEKGTSSTDHFIFPFLLTQVTDSFEVILDACRIKWHPCYEIFCKFF